MRRKADSSAGSIVRIENGSEAPLLLKGKCCILELRFDILHGVQFITIRRQNRIMRLIEPGHAAQGHRYLLLQRFLVAFAMQVHYDLKGAL